MMTGNGFAAKVFADPVVPRILVTRPDGDAQNWVLKLKHAGVDAEALPLIDIAPATGAQDVAALQQAWQALDSYAACLFVSGNAVKYFFRKNFRKTPATNQMALGPENGKREGRDLGAEQLGIPPQLRFLAPGPGTKAALIASGVPADQIDAPPSDAAQFDSESLWQVVGQRNWQGSRVLIVRGTTTSAGEGTGSSGRAWMASQWQAAGADVDFVSVYERLAPKLTPLQLGLAKAASTDGSVWLFSSSEALLNLTTQPSLQGIDWSRARAVATHPRIMDAVRSAGWGVVVASRPAFNDILNTLVSIESSFHE